MEIRGFGSLPGLGKRRTPTVRIQPRKITGVGRSSSFTNPTRDLARRLASLRDNAEQLKKAISLRDRSTASTSGSFSGVLVSGRLGKPAGPTRPTEPTTERGPQPPAQPRVLRSETLRSPSARPEATPRAFDGSSTARVTFGGTFDGSQGDAVELTFQVKKGGEVGKKDVQLEVRDDRGEKLETIKVDKEDAGDTFRLSNGVELTLSAGTLEKGETLTLNLASGDGTIDPTQAFGGSGLEAGEASVKAAFDRGSTAGVEVGGRFDGPFDDTLTIQVKRGGDVGRDDVELEVLDGNGERVDRVKFKKDGERTATLDNGLTLTLSEGTLEKKDGFTLDVKADDELVLAAGQRVRAGSFTVNDVTIEVEESDSIESVLAKITTSGAGVSARFDAATQTVELRPEEGADQGIRLADDTSGFLVAVGLEGKELAPPAAPEVEPPKVGGGRPEGPPPPEVTDVVDERLQGVGQGTFRINGRSIQVNEKTDTLGDVVERINTADAGVEARVRGGRLELRSLDRSATLEVEDGSSGFFRALDIEQGVHEPALEETEPTGPQAPGLATPNLFKDALTDFSAALRGVLGQGTGGGLPDVQAVLAESIRTALGQEAGDRPTTVDTELGLSFRLNGDGFGLDVDLEGVDRALTRSAADVVSFFTEGHGGEAQGLLDSITSAVDSTLGDLAAQLDPGQDAGLLFDIQA